RRRAVNRTRASVQPQLHDLFLEAGAHSLKHVQRGQRRVLGGRVNTEAPRELLKSRYAVKHQRAAFWARQVAELAGRALLPVLDGGVREGRGAGPGGRGGRVG